MQRSDTSRTSGHTYHPASQQIMSSGLHTHPFTHVTSIILGAPKNRYLGVCIWVTGNLEDVPMATSMM